MTEEEMLFKDLMLETAIHEAGHAVVMIHYNFSFQFITLKENPTLDVLGYIRYFSNIVPKTFSDINSIKNYCMYLLAGEVCSYKHNLLLTKDDWQTCREYVMEEMSIMPLGSNDLDDAFELITKYHNHRKKVYSVDNKIYCTFFQMIDFTEQLFTDSNGNDILLWKQVVKVADELMKRKTLYYNEVIDIINGVEG